MSASSVCGNLSGNNSTSDSSSSESDGEENSRLKEAAVDLSDVKQSFVPENFSNSKDKSKRLLGTTHQEENELNTTPEFRSFVAKHLDKMVERSVKVKIVKCTQSTSEAEDSESDFRLFSTSLVGKKDDEINISEKNSDNCQKPRASSSESDSDEDQRFTEAAVSAESILSESAIAVSSSDNVQKCSTLPAQAETLKGNQFKTTNFEDVTKTVSSAQKRRRRKKGKDTYNNGHILPEETCLDYKCSEHTSETIIPRKKRKKKSKQKIE